MRKESLLRTIPLVLYRHDFLACVFFFWWVRGGGRGAFGEGGTSTCGTLSRPFSFRVSDLFVRAGRFWMRCSVCP